MTLGEIVRMARQAAKVSLRALAMELAITPSYLSDIENDRRVPAEDVIRRLAQRLQLDPDVLLAAGGRLGETAERYLRQQPLAVALLRRLAKRRVDATGLARLLEQVERMP